MTIELPDNALGNLRLTSEEARIDLAAGLYAERRVSMGRAARIAGVPYVRFMHELGKRGICLNYSMEDLVQDIETVQRRLGK